HRAHRNRQEAPRRQLLDEADDEVRPPGTCPSVDEDDFGPGASSDALRDGLDHFLAYDRTFVPRPIDEVPWVVPGSGAVSLERLLPLVPEQPVVGGRAPEGG